jgi:hypothetical protein
MAENLIDTALTTLDRVKDELGIELTDDSSDDKLIRYINEATAFVEDFTDRTFGEVEGKEEFLSGSADNYLLLNNRPIIKINSITMNGSEITDFLVDPDDYARGMIYRERGWHKSTYLVGLAGDQFGEKRSILVNYDYGYVLPKDATTEKAQTLPRSLEAVVIKLVSLKHKENSRDSYGLKELKQGRLTLKFSNSMLEDNDLNILNKYKQVGVW